MKRTKSAHKLYVPLDHDVIDSPAYADLSPSTKNVLILIARQWSPATNGKLQATFSFCKQRGIGSQHTLQKAVAELISHGLICRTRSHGLDPRTGKNRPALYAITWRPIKLRDKPTDIFTSGFVFEAYKKWSCEKNQGGKKCSQSGAETALSAYKTGNLNHLQ
jgi:hypothetical protein